MKMKKKLLRAALTFCLAFACCTSAYAAEDGDIEGDSMVSTFAAGSENVTYVDAGNNEDLWQTANVWTSINENQWQLDTAKTEVTGNLQVKDYGGGPMTYVECTEGTNISADATVTVYYDRTKVGGIGTINGRQVGMKVKFSQMRGEECREISPEGKCPAVNSLAAFGVEMHKSGICINSKFWGGYTQHAIYQMQETYSLYYLDTGDLISQKGSMTTMNSLNKGELVAYLPEGADVEGLNSYVRTDHNLENGAYGAWKGISNDFVDNRSDPSFTKNSVAYQLCTDEPSFRMMSDSNDFWHAYTVAPLVATVPSSPSKVGIVNGEDKDQITDVGVGDELTFENRQRVQYLSISGSLKYKQFALLDQLPEELTYKNASVWYVKTDGTKVILNDSQVHITQSNGLIRAEFAAQYLSTEMPYEMETYVLGVTATVNDKSAVKNKYVNKGWSIINNKEQSPTEVAVVPRKPILAIQKSVDKTKVNTKDTANYTVVLTQTQSGAIATNATIQDALDQAGIEYVPGSFVIKDGAGKNITSSCQINVAADNRSVQIATNQNLKYNQKVTVTYQLLFKDHALAGKTVNNTATGGADNAASVTAKQNVVVLKPILKVEKQSPKYEYKVGDKVTYTVKVTQTVAEAIARNVLITDISLPVGLKVNDATASGVTGVNLTKQGTGWKVTAPNLKQGETITVSFDAIATEAVNVKETVNTVTAAADNAGQVQDVEEVFVNSAALSIQKEVSQYQWKVGETVNYTVVVSNTKPDSIANKVEISDITIPAGLQLESYELLNVPDQVNRPVRGNKTVHGEKKGEKVTSSIEQEKSTWTAKISALPANVPVTIRFTCIVEEAANGMEIINTAHAKAENAADVKDNAKIWINSPGLQIKKDADIRKVKVGDLITYTLQITNQKTGTVAHDVVIDDTIAKASDPYVKLQKNSIVLMDSEGQRIEHAKISVKDNYFKIETERNLIHPENYSIWNLEDGDKKLDGGKFNPEAVELETEFTVEYQVKVVSEEAAGESLNNIATANSKEDIPAEDEEDVVVNGPHLDVEKTSDKKAYTTAETAKYKVTVRQTREGYKAKKVVLTDAITPKGATIIADTIQVKLNGEVLEPKSITMQAGDTGYSMETGIDLADDDKLVITYDVKFADFATDTVDKTFLNVVVAKGSNTNESQADNEVIVTEKDAVLAVVKKADRKEYLVGETGKYTLQIFEQLEDAIAKQVTIKDTFDKEGLTIVQDTIVVKVNSEKIEPKSIQLNDKKNGYTIETGVNLSFKDKMVVTYDVKFDKVIEGEETTNTAVVKAENTNEATDDHTVTVKEIIPVLAIEKTSDKKSYYVGETGKYEITVKQTESKAVAKQVVLTDAFDREGITMVEKTVVVKLNGNVIKPKAVSLNDAKDGYTIETGINLTRQDILTVSYDVVFETAVKGEQAINTAIVKAENAKEKETEYKVTVKEVLPALVVEKSADKQSYLVGETGKYQIVVTQPEKNAIAKQVIIKDSFDKKGMTIQGDTLSLTINKKEIKPKSFSLNDTKTGYTIETGIDMQYQDEIVVTYDVKFEKAVEEGMATNTALAKADNAEEKKDTHTVNVGEVIPELSIEKSADRKEAVKGDLITYTLQVTEKAEGIAKNVVLEDDMKFQGMKLLGETIKVFDQDKKEITKECVIATKERSFRILTNRDLKQGETLTVTYESRVEQASPGDTIRNVATAQSDNISIIQTEYPLQVPTIAETVAAAVQTGLKNHAAFYAGIAILLLVGAGILIKRKKKKHDDGKI